MSDWGEESECGACTREGMTTEQYEKTREKRQKGEQEMREYNKRKEDAAD